MKRILDRTCYVCDITEEKLKTKGRTVKQIYARMAYFLALHIIGKDIHDANREFMGFAHTMPSYYLRTAIEKFERNIKFRNVVQGIVKNNDKFIKFANRHPNKILSQCAKAVKRDAPKPTHNKTSEPDKGGKLFYFTDEEEKAIERARKEIPIWFEKKYGQGQKPKEYFWT